MIRMDTKSIFFKKDLNEFMAKKSSEPDFKKGFSKLQRIREKNLKDSGWIDRDLYRLLFNEDLFLDAYEKSRKNIGALTKGMNSSTVDGFSLFNIKEIINALRDDSFRFTPSQENLHRQAWEKDKKAARNTYV